MLPRIDRPETRASRLQRGAASLAPLVLLAACTSVPLLYETSVPPGGHGELDSVALWVAPNPWQSLLLVTDKTQNYLELHDPITNTYLGRVGGTGTAPGRFRRPNSVAVAYDVPSAAGPLDVAFVVERDNRRVSTYLLPYFFWLGSFGEAYLDQPMGIALHWEGAVLQAWITDVGHSPDTVFVFDVGPTASGLTGTLRLSFQPGAGAVLESIVIDPVARRALLCDEGARDVMVFDLQGNPITRFGSGRFTNDPEGIVLTDLGDGSGYIVVTDQNAVPVQFEVFDRQSFVHLTCFSGPTHGTDGVTLVQEPLPGLPGGSFFAVHLDRSVHAYDWAAIASAARLCTELPCVPVAAEDGAAPPAPRLSAHPNPFNPRTTIEYQVDGPGRVVVQVYDASGRALDRLVDAVQPAGAHRATWNAVAAGGTPLPSGTYFVRLVHGTTVRTHKLTLLR